MKKFLFASAAVAAVFAAAPAFAGSGFVDLGYSDIHSGDLKSWSLGGAAVANVSGDWNVQGDGHVNRLDVGYGTFNFSNGALHAFQRNADHAFGGYFGAADFQGLGAYGLGLEGAKYFDRFTLSGQLGYDWVEAYGTSENGWSASLNGKFFATDNFSVGAGLHYADLDGSKVTTWSIGAEVKPDTMPVSFFADYRKHTPDDGFFIFGSEDVSVWSLGVRWNIGGGSLKSRDRTGASMTGGDSFSRALF